MLLAVLAGGTALADWKEEQAALFKQIPVKPGDRIDSSNWEKVKDLLPPSMVNWVKKGDFVINIKEFNWDYTPDAAWRQASAANAGKYEIGPNGELIDKATGKVPVYVNAEPFPHIDWKNDPQVAIKTAWNNTLRKSRSGKQSYTFNTNWVGRKGQERDIKGVTFNRYFWGRPDGEINNSAGILFNEIALIREPYDVAGIVSLTQRSIANTPDQVYSYVPAIRRVKKVSGTTRSSPFLGTDLTLDDGVCWNGKNESMEWKVVDRKIVLLPVPNYALDGPVQFIRQKDGSWASPSALPAPRWGFEVKDWKGAPWTPVDTVYVPRMMSIIEAKPKDPYYNYGLTTYYVDDVAGWTYKIINDTAGDYWKTNIISYAPTAWDNRVAFFTTQYNFIVDDKSDHASVSNTLGAASNGFTSINVYNDPNVSAATFAPTSLSTLSK